MNEELALNKEKCGRIIDIVPFIFSSGYMSEKGVIFGGIPLNLEFPERRFPTDIDLFCLDDPDSSFEKRNGHFADELRSIAGRTGYGFKIRIGRHSKAKLFYNNHLGAGDCISIDVHTLPYRYFLEPVEREYPETGRIRTLQLEEMVGRKISMLSRPKPRGQKRFSDLLDVYHSTKCENIDEQKLKRVFIQKMTSMGVKIRRDHLVKMIDWNDPDRFQSGIESKTEYQINFYDLRDSILSRYRYLCNLSINEKRYNDSGIHSIN